MATIMRVGGGGSAGGNIISITVESGTTVYGVNGDKVVSGVSVNGVATLKVKAGTWRIWGEKNGETTYEIEVVAVDNYYDEIQFGLPLRDLAEGALVKINESGVGKNFYVAKHNYESTLNGAGRTLLVRKDAYKSGAFSSGKNTYADGTMDTWHNGTYKPMLSAKVQELVGTTTFYYTPGGVTSGNGIKMSTLSRSVFQLSLTEFGLTRSGANAEGSALPIAETLKTCYRDGTTSTTTQWTRTPSVGTNTTSVFFVTVNGSASAQDADESSQYRPCFTLPATAVVYPNLNADGSYTLKE